MYVSTLDNIVLENGSFSVSSLKKMFSKPLILYKGCFYIFYVKNFTDSAKTTVSLKVVNRVLKIISKDEMHLTIVVPPLTNPLGRKTILTKLDNTRSRF